MKSNAFLVKAMSWLALAMIALPAPAADYPAPSEGSWVVLDREMKRMKNGRVLLIPGSDQTFGHGTTGRPGSGSSSSAKCCSPHRATRHNRSTR